MISAAERLVFASRPAMEFTSPELARIASPGSSADFRSSWFFRFFKDKCKSVCVVGVKEIETGTDSTVEGGGVVEAGVEVAIIKQAEFEVVEEDETFFGDDDDDTALGVNRVGQSVSHISHLCRVARFEKVHDGHVH
jgi:hypothetical protein